MYKGGSRAIPVIILLVVVVAAIIGLVLLGRLLLGGNAPKIAENDPAAKALLTTDADYSVRMTVRGPIVADEDFRSYTVTISPTGRQMVSHKGFDNNVIDNTQLTNNLEAYTQFVGALDRANFVKSATLSNAENDTQGVCATGRLYTFEILQAQSAVKQLWTTSCNGVAGSFRGDATTVRSLFLRQIPNSNNLLRTINLSA